ncbi:MAG: trigger factor, partial [Gammaproteobacteria bacterium]|nr:trigger factor [Gammaproteobacteria bacterium]
MQVSVEALEGLERKLTVEVPVARIDEAVTERLRSLVKTVKMDGFRPGKVPLKVVQKRYGSQVRREVMGEVIQSSFQEAVVEEKLSPAGMPRIESLPETEATFRYSAIFEIYPKVELQSLSGEEIEEATAQVQDSDVDGMLENLRKQRTHYHAVERGAEEGDQVTLDFAGFVDGEAVENAKAEQYQLVIGNSQLIPGFEEQLIGIKSGEERTLSVQFPDDYKPEDLAGKPAEFNVKVHSVGAPHVPEIDEEFAKAFGVEEGSVAALRDKVRANMERELRQTLRGKVKSQVMDRLLEANEVLLPAALVQQEIARLKHQITQGADLQLQDEPFTEEAERRVKLGLLVAEIVSSNELQADPDKVREMIEEIAAPYEDPQQVVN